MVPSGSLSVRRKLAIGVFALALVVVAVLLLMPAGSLPPTDVWDKLEHAGAIAGLAILGLIAFPKRTSLGWLALGLIGFGSVCELLQNVTGRDASVRGCRRERHRGVARHRIVEAKHLAVPWPSGHKGVRKVMAPRWAPSPKFA